MRRLCLILGDQLNRDSALFKDFDPQQDRLWMAEVHEESTHVWSHKQRIALFLSAMRHFAADLKAEGWPLDYFRLGAHHFKTLRQALAATLRSEQPQEVRLVRPGDYRVLGEIVAVCREHNIPLRQLTDKHFLSTPGEFKDWVGAKQPRMEFWYRELRKRYQVLMEEGKPLGGKWNYDHDNRGTFSRNGPENLPVPPVFTADEITLTVLEIVQEYFPDHSGELTILHWPVTAQQAETVLQRFLDQVLPQFGEFQDAMWTGQPFLFHSLISSALNLKLLDPLTVIQQAEQRYHAGEALLASVEGFIRQILGWREYVRGLYWLHMPDWYEMNALEAEKDLPEFYWTGDTEMTCLRESISQTLEYGYAHHIQRLMVTGLFAQLYGVNPQQVHEWYLAVYVDAVEWVELPNTLGMSQYADGGIMASKPYIASGNYINKMSNYCKHCRFKPAKATGDDACPFTTLFWDFLDRHEERFDGHPRMGFMLKNLQRKPDEERMAIREQAGTI
ncbi:MAG: cryptochrome/photolyase family protein [Thiolinea sp.]